MEGQILGSERRRMSWRRRGENEFKDKEKGRGGIV